MIGSRLAARRAGQMPKKSPTSALKPNATATESGDTSVFHCMNRDSATAAPVPARMPRIPPTRQSTSASTRNCSRMSRRVAPSALRTPISRVRSVTETSMMFMIPIPPTTRLTAAMLASRVVNTWVASF